jgi:hypothetical protein
MTRASTLSAAMLAIAMLLTADPGRLSNQQTTTVAIDGDDIGGVVRSPGGPEAGAWVIAEDDRAVDQVRQDGRHRRAGPLRHS